MLFANPHPYASVPATMMHQTHMMHTAPPPPGQVLMMPVPQQMVYHVPAPQIIYAQPPQAGSPQLLSYANVFPQTGHNQTPPALYPSGPLPTHPSPPTSAFMVQSPATPQWVTAQSHPPLSAVMTSLPPATSPIALHDNVTPLAPELAPRAHRSLSFFSCRQQRSTRPLEIPPQAPGDTEPGPRQLIVNYLSLDIDSQELYDLFTPFGEVELARVASDSATGRSIGYGFVYMKRHADAAAAIDQASGRVLLGKRVRVSYAVPQRPLAAMATNGAVMPSMRSISPSSATPGLADLLQSPSTTPQPLAAGSSAAYNTMSPGASVASEYESNMMMPRTPTPPTGI